MSGRWISERLAAIALRPVARGDRARAALHLLDWAGCVVAGTVEPGTAEVRRLAAREGAGPCTVVGGAPAGPQAAALANGPAGAILEMDDVDKRALLHPGPVVWPAALAVAQAQGLESGAALLDAGVRGYEAMIRVGRAVGPGHYARFHATATCGGFGAATAGASLLGLSQAQMAWALGNAGQQAFGLWRVRHEPVFTKALHDGWAAANGVAAALLAADGFAGPLGVFEGEQGFFAGFCPDGDAAWVAADPDAAWAIHDVSFKPHAACRHGHAVIDAVLALRARAEGAAPELIEVASYADALTFCDRPEPRSPAQAKFSLQHAAAVAWRFGDAGLVRFTPEAIAEPATAALRARVRVAEDPGASARYPARFGASARVRLADGREIAVETPDALGDPERPVGPEDLKAKARALMAWGGLDASATDRLIAAALSLAEGGSVPDFAAALPGALPGAKSGARP